MNYCRKCQSDYEKPGTCNCFAPAAAAAPLPWTITPQPYYPPWPQYPQIWWGSCPTITTSGYSQTVGGYTVDANSVAAPFSYTDS
jgi:hypothetical protein